MYSKKILVSIILFFLAIFLFILWFAGWFMTKPANREVAQCPSDLECENVEFQSRSKSIIKGWLVKGEPENGVIVLLHGVRANRSDMIERMKFLVNSGFTVLSIDFQSHGESIGNTITFGHLEKYDSKATLEFVKRKFPNEKIGVIGISMGGAAFLLSDNKTEADAVILEMVYSTMQQAIDNRLNMWLFIGADIFSPLLTYQFEPRLGFSVDELRPIDQINKINKPIMFIVGEKDLNTTISESRDFFGVANEPKQIFIVANASHQDLHKIKREDYEAKVLKFFSENIKKVR